MLQQHLAQAEAHVALADRNVARQRKLVAELERDGHSTTEAKRLLALFEEILVTYIADRDRLRRELEATPD